MQCLQSMMRSSLMLALCNCLLVALQHPGSRNLLQQVSPELPRQVMWQPTQLLIQLHPELLSQALQRLRSQLQSASDLQSLMQQTTSSSSLVGSLAPQEQLHHKSMYIR